MDLSIMEWNINQRMNYSKTDMPEWIADVIQEHKADIVILTELYKGNNWDNVKKKAFDDVRYNLFESSNYQGGNNDVAIAINKDKLDVIYAKTYFSCNHTVPDHLEVKCKAKGVNKEILVVGMRIHAMNITDKEKEEQLKFVLNSVIDENVIIGGDFNNNRRGYTAPGHWHIQRMDEIIANHFERKTPEGSSIYVENPLKVEYEFAEDHFLIKGIESDKFILEPYNREFCEKDRNIYKWRNDFQEYMGKDKKGNNMYNSIPAPYPDHAFIKGYFEL